jgi:hypothetical protein
VSIKFVVNKQLRFALSRSATSVQTAPSETDNTKGAQTVRCGCVWDPRLRPLNEATAHILRVRPGDIDYEESKDNYVWMSIAAVYSWLSLTSEFWNRSRDTFTFAADFVI